MKNLFFILILTLSINLSFAARTKVYFTPKEGKKAFKNIETMIANANEYVYLTAYSWSFPTRDKDKKIIGIVKAIITARKNSVPVRIVVRPALAKSRRFIPKMRILEGAGVEIKIAHQGMHEKFIIVDGKSLMNGSANLSGGARDRYNENLVFHYVSKRKKDPINCLIKQFKHEFALLWNSSKDYKLSDEENAAPLKVVAPKCVKKEYAKQALLFSSSKNWIYTKNERRTKTDKRKYKEGRNYSYKRRGGKKNQTWLVKDEIVNALNNASHSVHLCLNHFMIKDVANAVLDAVKRGLKVELAVDNHEFKNRYSGKSTVMTPYFVQEWKKLGINRGKELPVRVKFYSLALTHSYALLNHHKFILIDYGHDSEMLISGSHNISKQAEHNQYDNMVFYRGANLKHLYDRFYGEFLNLWSLNRDRSDNPDSKLYNYFVTRRRGSTRYPMHLNRKGAVSLTWREIEDLRKRVRDISGPFYTTASDLFKKPEEDYKVAGDFWYAFGKFKECQYYNPKMGIFEKSVKVKKKWKVVPCDGK